MEGGSSKEEEEVVKEERGGGREKKKKKRKKTINIKILSIHSNPHVFSSFSSDNLRTKRRASSFRFIRRIMERKKNKKGS